MNFRFIFLFLLLVSSLFSEDEAEFSLVGLSKSPIPKVHGTVSVISGSWVDQNIHSRISGPDSYSLGHSYSSLNLDEEGSIAYGWDFLHPSDLSIYQPGGLTYNPNDIKPPSDYYRPHTILDETNHFFRSDSLEHNIFATLNSPLNSNNFTATYSLDDPNHKEQEGYSIDESDIEERPIEDPEELARIFEECSKTSFLDPNLTLVHDTTDENDKESVLPPGKCWIDSYPDPDPSYFLNDDGILVQKTPLPQEPPSVKPTHHVQDSIAKDPHLKHSHKDSKNDKKHHHNHHLTKKEEHRPPPPPTPPSSPFSSQSSESQRTILPGEPPYGTKRQEGTTPRRYYEPVGDPRGILSYREGGGSTVAFKANFKKFSFSAVVKKAGYTFISSVENPSQLDVKRTRLGFFVKEDMWETILSDGTRRLYKRTDHFKHRITENDYYDKNKAPKRAFYCIKDEYLPSGNFRHYSYDNKHRIDRIETRNSKSHLMGFVTFAYHDDRVVVKTSDDKKITFVLKKLHDLDKSVVVESIEQEGAPTIYYGYNDSKYHRRLNEKRYSHGLHEWINYYKEEGATVAGEFIKIPHGDESFFKGRVSEIWSKTLKGQDSFLSQAFTYKKWDHSRNAKVKEYDNASTSYIWDIHNRPTWVGYYGTDGKTLGHQHFEWEYDYHEYKGSLLHRIFYDENKQPILSKSFFHDGYGNVSQEILRGSFTGRSHTPLSVDDDHRPHNGEKVVIKAHYTRHALKDGDIDALGNQTLYEYEESRDLLTARYTCSQDKVIKREFFTYDASGICIESIVDDGIYKGKDELRSVTFRTITKTTPRSSYPNFGTPEVEEVYTWTPKNGTVLYAETRTFYNEKGLAYAKKLYDVDRVVQKKWSFSYDSLYRLIETIDPTGAFEYLEYNDVSQVIKRTIPGATITYKYDLLGRPLEEISTFPDGTQSSINHDYDYKGRKVSSTDSRGRTKTEYKDLLGRITKTINPALSVENIGVQSPEVSVSYQGSSEIYTSPLGTVTKIQKSATGKPLVTTSPQSENTFYYYDLKSRLVEQRDPSGLVTTYEYDSLDRPTRITQSGDGISTSITKIYNTFQLLREIHPTKTIDYTYDGFGRKIHEVTTDLITNQQATTHFFYDSLHRLIRTLQEEVHQEEVLLYDKADRVIDKKVYGDSTLLSHTYSVFDLEGHEIEKGALKDSTFSISKTTFGAYGLPSMTEAPDGTQAHFFYEPLHKGPDNLFYLKRTTINPQGVITEELIDANDQVRSFIMKDPYGTLLAKKLISVSILGKPTLQEDFAIEDGEIKSSSKTRFVYNSFGELTSCIMAEGTQDSATWFYRYDTLGRKIEEEKPSGIVFRSSFDSRSRLVHFSSSDNSISVHYSYNIQSLPTTIHNDITNKDTSRSYDGLGHLLTETLETDLSFSYTTDARGILSSITYPDGTSTNYTYSNGLLKSVNRLSSDPYSYQIESRNHFGTITQATLPFNTPITYSQDIMGRMTSIHHPSFSEERTSFSPVGTLLQRTINGTQESFSYDYLTQLTNDNGRQSTYDSLHNRTSYKGTPATHNARNQVLSQGSDQYIYDIDGRRIQDSNFHYQYDALDRLTAVENDSSRETFTYDPFHRRLSTTSYIKESGSWKETNKELYLWQGDFDVGSTDSAKNIHTLRILGETPNAEIAASISYEIDHQIYIPIHDLSGHVRALLNKDGSIAETLTYSATALESRTSNITPWTFSSKREDPLTSFLFFGRRFYDPKTSTWLTQDPLGTQAGPNLYAYVRNNPLTLFDPFGLLESDRSFLERTFDSCSSFCGSIFDGFSGFCGSVFNGLSGIASSISDGISNGCNSALERISGFCKSVYDHTCQGLSALFHSNPNPARNPTEITYQDEKLNKIDPLQRSDNKSHVSVATRGSKGLKGVLEDNPEGLVLAEVNGIFTTYAEACLRAQKILESQKDVVAVIIVYNSTNMFLDLIEACFNTYGISTQVTEVLTNALATLFDTCKEEGISFRADFLCHSQGAAIGSIVLDGLKESNYGNFINRQVNFGGSVMVQGAINYVAVGDFVPWLNIFSVGKAISNGFQNVIFVSCPVTSLLTAHFFEGVSYQAALDHYFKSVGK